MTPDQPSQPLPPKRLQIKPTLHRPAVHVDLRGAIDIYRQALAAGIVIHAEFVARQLAEALPDELDAQLPLLDAYTNTLRGEPADRFAGELLERFPNNIRVLKAAARYYQASGDGARALDLLNAGRALVPADPEVPWLIGVTRTALGDREQAIAAFDEAISMAPAYADAWFSRSLLTRGDAAGDALVALERLIAAGTEPPLKLGKLHLAAAWCHDGKNPQGQFAHLERAGALFNSVFPWNEQRARQQMAAITGFIDAALVNALQGTGNPQPAPIYIAALPRSGTTLLEQILGSHSGVTPIGESQLFNHAISQVGFDLERPTAYWDWGQGRDFAPILARFDALYHQHAGVLKAGSCRIVEKSLDNYMTAGLILLTHPNARMIHLARHPLDTILSMYQHYIEMGPNIPFILEDLARHYLIVQEYLTHWKGLFGDRVLTVDYETLVTDSESAVRRILHFCELPWEPACLDHRQRDATVNTPSTLQVRQKMHSGAVNRWKQFARQLQPAADILNLEI